MDMLTLISVAAHVVTISAIGIYVIKFAVSKYKNFPLLCLQLLGPLIALLIVLNADDIGATLSRFNRAVSSFHVYLGAIMFLFFQQLMPGGIRK
ncbi:hypothetical protein [Sporosarcina cyprini]|uniref:hypothetical protein n=1 Tax=Sporosarcina cyprini TaxID=2910523 RepID=UPI001EDE472F|nr:hypothetical protein [Sporosarcina cyprini]MCG3087271.1 hypothetical protein [Sporosarcina cyprini]